MDYLVRIELSVCLSIPFCFRVISATFCSSSVITGDTGWQCFCYRNDRVFEDIYEAGRNSKRFGDDQETTTIYEMLSGFTPCVTWETYEPVNSYKLNSRT